MPLPVEELHSLAQATIGHHQELLTSTSTLLMLKPDEDTVATFVHCIVRLGWPSHAA
jgi:hypothetical protein